MFGEASKFLNAIANNDYVGMTIINKDGYVVFRNKVSEEISGIKNQDVLNKHFSIIRGKGELLEVLRTGKPKLGLTYPTKSGKNAVVHRFPIYDFGLVIGAMTIISFKDAEEMESILRKYNLLKEELEYYKKELRKERSARYSLSNILSNDKKMIYLKGLAKKYGRSKSPVIIMGETGTGKELFAHAIHLSGPRKNGPFIKVNCSSIPNELLESELFGYEPGAFTGAKREGRAGKFELANKGTIFLDEIGSMDLRMQSKLLRVLQENEVERLGGNKVIKLDIKVISATNENLEHLIKEEKFRLDLYYRLVVLSINVPPLRERKNDIPVLCSDFIKAFNREMGGNIKGIDDNCMKLLMNWSWPGNVRELRNVIERAFNVAENGVINIYDLPGYIIDDIKTDVDINKRENSLKEARSNIEKKMVESTLNNNGWNISKSSKLLGISRQLLYLLIKKYNLNRM